MLTKTFQKTCRNHVELIPLDKVKCLDNDWLWPDYIPLGMLTLIAGDPGVGKSFLTLYMAATVSTGRPWPRSPVGTKTPQSFPKEKFAKQIYCGAAKPLAESRSSETIPEPQSASHESGSVLILNNEDVPSKTICPRLAALNANLSKIKLIPLVWHTDKYGNEYASQFNIVNDILNLDAALTEIPDIKLVIIDPLMSFFGYKDTYRDSHVRASLLPLSALARKFNIAVVCVMHLNKGSSSKIIYRTMGSQAFSAFARSVWFVNPLPNPENKKKCLLLPAKNNIMENPQSIAFEIKDNHVIFDDKPFNESAQDVLSTFSRRRDGGEIFPQRFNIESPELNRAVAWLKNLFLDGNPLPSKKIFSLAKEQGFTKWTLQRARKKIGIKCFPKKDEFGQIYWSWKLPRSEAEIPADAGTQNPCS
jgi:hypothetical protein